LNQLHVTLYVFFEQDAAERFVRYWEGRREVFGNEKYVLPMTLSEALKDDLAAIEAGVYLPLPKKDLSGRSMMYLEPHRNTGKGYSSESLVSTIVAAMFSCVIMKSPILTILL
jgi:hypothetical protein